MRTLVAVVVVLVLVPASAAAVRRAQILEIKPVFAPATWHLSTSIIRRHVRLRLPAFRHCYQMRLPQMPRLAGTVVTEFVVDGDGAVIAAEASGMDPAVARCVRDVFAAIQFPDHGLATADDLIFVRYPLNFRRRR